MAGAKLSQPGRAPTYWRVECHPKLFHAAFADFKNFFQTKTGIAWDDRLDGTPSIPDPFKYSVPTLGRPLGSLIEGKKHPEQKKIDDAAVKDGDSGVDVDGLIHDSDSDVSGRFDSEHTPKPLPRGRRATSLSYSSSSVSGSS
jgi:hypothetical protein